MVGSFGGGDGSVVDGAAVDAAEAMTSGFGAKNDCMVVCLAWPVDKWMARRPRRVSPSHRRRSCGGGGLVRG